MARNVSKRSEVGGQKSADEGKTWTDEKTGLVYDMINHPRSDPEAACSKCAFVENMDCPEGKDKVALCINLKDAENEFYFRARAAGEVKAGIEPVTSNDEPVTGSLAEIALGDVYPSPYQVREVSGTPELDAGIAELAASIKANGLANPLTVRKTAKGYELIAGHRRYEACMVAGLLRAPCYVRDVSDAAAEDLLVVENLQRKDLSPLEEAESVRRMMEHGRSHEEIAAATGKSVRWVYRRAKLSDLSDLWRRAGLRWKLSARYLEEIARLPLGVQGTLAAREKVAELIDLPDEEIEDYDVEGFQRGGDVEGVVNQIWSILRKVVTSPWAGERDWCAGCVKRTDGDGFDSGDDDEPCCMDGECWERKTEEWMEEARAEHKGSLAECSEYRSWQYRHEKDAVGGFTVPVLVTETGVRDYGRVVWARDESEEEPSQKKPKAVPLTKEQKRRAAYVLAVRDLVSLMESAEVDRPGGEKERVGIDKLAALALTFGTGYQQPVAGRLLALCACADENLPGLGDKMWGAMRNNIMNALRVYREADCEAEYAMAAAVALALGLDAGAVKDQQDSCVKRIGKK